MIGENDYLSGTGKIHDWNLNVPDKENSNWFFVKVLKFLLLDSWSFATACQAAVKTNLTRVVWGFPYIKIKNIKNQ